MRFKVNLTTNTEVEGINTLNAVHRWIYKNLELVDKHLADWLHNKGIFYEKVMKPINFSPLYKIKSSKNTYGVKISSSLPKVVYALTQVFEDPLPLTIIRRAIKRIAKKAGIERRIHPPTVKTYLYNSPLRTRHRHLELFKHS
ncbi:MAG: hypothetical protein NZ845_01280 [Thermodesulfovibrio sp.]|nr:hypothetical protein [Thermodesulfovibrio sp.]